MQFCPQNKVVYRILLGDYTGWALVDCWFKSQIPRSILQPIFFLKMMTAVRNDQQDVDVCEIKRSRFPRFHILFENVLQGLKTSVKIRYMSL